MNAFRKCAAILALAAIAMVPGCASSSRTTKGAVIGGASGAAVGAVIG
jgi:hypothetical protein